jgi:hypothetical protein
MTICVEPAGMNVRVYWMDTAGGEEGDGAWYWIETDKDGFAFDDAEPVGPFKTAIEAGRDTRKSIIKE